MFPQLRLARSNLTVEHRWTARRGRANNLTQRLAAADRLLDPPNEQAAFGQWERRSCRFPFKDISDGQSQTHSGRGIFAPATPFVRRTRQVAGGLPLGFLRWMRLTRPRRLSHFSLAWLR